jgi:hypothetical protein
MPALVLKGHSDIVQVFRTYAPTLHTVRARHASPLQMVVQQ